jgi:hypothetical protein
MRVILFESICAVDGSRVGCCAKETACSETRSGYSRVLSRVDA